MNRLGSIARVAVALIACYGGSMICETKCDSGTPVYNPANAPVKVCLDARAVVIENRSEKLTAAFQLGCVKLRGEDVEIVKALPWEPYALKPGATLSTLVHDAPGDDEKCSAQGLKLAVLRAAFSDGSKWELGIRGAVGQQGGVGNPILLDERHPSVYLQFEGERKPEHPRDGNDGLRLRIHNNTRGAICIRTQSLYLGSKVAPLALMSGKHVLGIRDGVEIAPLYSVEQEHESGFERLPLTWHGDVSSISWIPSGGTVLMSLPMGDLVKGRRVVVPFSYEWELEGDAIAHEAFFYGRDVSQ